MDLYTLDNEISSEAAMWKILRNSTKEPSIVCHLPGRHLPPPKFGHLPPPKLDIYRPRNRTFARRTTAAPNFFFFWRTFLGFLDLQLMEDIKDGKEEVLDEVVMEHIK